MDDQQLRDLLHACIADVDSGRVTVPRPRGLTAALGAPVLAAALGLGACAGAGSPPARDPGASRPPAAADAATPMDPGPQPEYAAPPPMDRPPPPMDPGAVAEYAVPAMDPGPQPEYAAPPHRE